MQQNYAIILENPTNKAKNHTPPQHFPPQKDAGSEPTKAAALQNTESNDDNESKASYHRPARDSERNTGQLLEAVSEVIRGVLLRFTPHLASVAIQLLHILLAPIRSWCS